MWIISSHSTTAFYMCTHTNQRKFIFSIIKKENSFKPWDCPCEMIASRKKKKENKQVELIKLFGLNGIVYCTLNKSFMSLCLLVSKQFNLL
jgi:hypothetical protein